MPPAINKQYCILVAFEDVGCGRSLENYYRNLLSSKIITPLIAYTNLNSYKTAPSWITNKTYRPIKKVDSPYEDSFIKKPRYRNYSEFFFECQNYISQLRHQYGENTIWVVDESLPELEPYMGKYIVQVFHGELFDIGASYFRYPNNKCFKHYSLILAYGQLLKNRTIKKCRLHPNDPRIKIIGRVLDDTLHDNSFPPKKILQEFGLDQHKKTILFATSWESRKIWPFGNKAADTNFYSDKNKLKTLCEFAKKYNLNLIIRPHTISINHYRVDIPIHQVIKNYKNVFFNDNTDYHIEGPNKSLSASDILITDLSSIATDFLTLKRPVIFLYPDQKDGFWIKIPSFRTVSKFDYTAKNLNQFYKILTKLVTQKEPLDRQKHRQKIATYCIKYSDGKAGIRFRSCIENLAKSMRLSNYINLKYLLGFFKYQFRLYSQPGP
jgi:hypothetical protein